MPNRKNIIAVTGGAGFIGSNFIRFYLRHTRTGEVYNIDNLSYCGRIENTLDFRDSPRYHFIKEDITDEMAMKRVFAMIKPDTVINFAAQTHVDRSIKDPRPFLETDIMGVFNLLEANRDNKHLKKFIQISTDEVYGSIEKGSFRENSPVCPSSPYSASKLGGERIAHSYHVTYGMPVLVIRGSNNYGPFQYPEKFIPRNVVRLLSGKNALLYAAGKNIRDWIYVEDFVRGIMTVLKKGRPGEIYNIGGADERTNIELLGAILSALGLGKERISFVKDRPGHDLRYSISCGKVRALGWRKEVPLSRGLKETIEWYKNNKSWWKDILKEI